MATLTQRNHPDPAEFQKVLGARLVMMKRAQGLAMTALQTDLADLMKEILAPYTADHLVQISGPAFTLIGEAASAIALVTHELATNATKYGALSRLGGELEVSWSILPSQANPKEFEFRFVWLERNGPAVIPPSRRGYGTVMMNGTVRNSFGGSVAFDYDPKGLKCEISAPLTSRLGHIATS
ncbi:hypothetical protein GCM10009304_18010 [Pseudomonas matsuisoli]|uniref:histidine kinase n=2 Tax=Pseudomonas matsuisoli TaxID=1515666 RepID=A0A917PV61_9PSED|nr:hypothetical protein GCM10009304_18010 [Pseudomonas matsuisoli]